MELEEDEKFVAMTAPPNFEREAGMLLVRFVSGRKRYCIQLPSEWAIPAATRVLVMLTSPPKANVVKMPARSR